MGLECPKDQKPGLWRLREEMSRGTYSKDHPLCEELVVTLVGHIKDFKWHFKRNIVYIT